MPPPSAGTELAPPPPPGAKTPPPTKILHASPQQRTPSPPSKRQRGRSTPPSPRSPAPPTSPRRRSSSTPPPMERVSSEPELVAPASAPNRRMLGSKLKYSPEKDGKANGGPVAIFWDFENCSVPKGTSPEAVYVNVTEALQRQQLLTGPPTKFVAYGDFSNCKMKESQESSGIKVHHVAHKKMKDAADLVILTQMFFFAMDNPRSALIVLISGDGDFAASLHGLQQRGYRIAVAFQSSIHSSPDLTRPADVVWDWPLLARGQHGSGVLKRICCCPSDLQELEVHMIKVLQSAEYQTLPLSRVPAEYCNMFLRPLVVTNYGCTDLADLFKNLDSNLFNIFGGGVNMSVYLNSPP